MALDGYQRRELREAAARNFARFKANGGNFKKLYENSKPAELNFYKSTGFAEKNFREAVDALSRTS